MNTNKKILKLINCGLSGNLLSSLNESQINTLYSRLSEQVTKQTIQQTTVGPEGGTIALDPSKKTLSLSKDPNKPNTFKITQTESEMTEDSNGDLDLALALQSKEMNEKFESKAQQKFFWAKCNRSKGKEKEKWCTMAKEFSDKTTKKDYKKIPEKKEQKESYLDMVGKAMNKNMMNKISDIKPSVNWVSELENKIDKLVETHLSPKMKKSDLVKLVSETEVAPVKTPTKPSKPIPSTPYRPKPGPKPAPKAETKEQSPTIAPPKPKTPTKPDTPYRPKPGPKPAPKAKSDEMPNWLMFNKLGIKLK